MTGNLRENRCAEGATFGPRPQGWGVVPWGHGVVLLVSLPAIADKILG